jgi:hypothetical protein
VEGRCSGVEARGSAGEGLSVSAGQLRQSAQVAE